MARTATASAAPRAPGFLRAALLLLLLVAACRQAAAAPMVLAEETVVNELRCQCLETLPGIHPKNIQSVKVTSPGPHCDRTEVIATLKNGQKVCLNPASPVVKKILEKMLNKDSSN
ncbi:growth-regulated protein homolog gamma-like [Myotis myotis]|uniref:growth-regulated protein homolog gamma-like n=1 Tax=Myotis myotis TaxID=51298 RepID=UPI0017497446|nr:growth-regulated protein homolog gamma-like [Myotis myotis]